MNRNFYKEVESYKEIKGFIQNEYIRIADMNKLYDMPFDIKLCIENKIQQIIGDNGK